MYYDVATQLALLYEYRRMPTAARIAKLNTHIKYISL